MLEKILQTAKLPFLGLSVFGLLYLIIFPPTPPDVKTLQAQIEQLKRDTAALGQQVRDCNPSSGPLTLAAIQSGINNLPPSTQLGNLLSGTRFENLSYNCPICTRQPVGQNEVKNWLASQSGLTLSTVASWNNKLQQELNDKYLKKPVKLILLPKVNSGMSFADYNTKASSIIPSSSNITLLKVNNGIFNNLVDKTDTNPDVMSYLNNNSAIGVIRIQ